MALTRTNGLAAPVVTTGRDLAWYTFSAAGLTTSAATVDGDFEKIVRAISTLGTVEILGTPGASSANVARVAISGAAPTAATLSALANTAVGSSAVVFTAITI